MNGLYSIGFEVNKVTKFRLQFGPRTVIGGFNLQFDKRMFFVFKAVTEMDCLSIRRKQFYQLIEKHPYFSNCLKIKFLYNYDSKIRIPLIKKK